MLAEGKRHAAVAAINELGFDLESFGFEMEALRGGVAIGVVDAADVEDKLRALRIGSGNPPRRAPA
jgi:hypothetical protein